jgi:HK97 gp10 family phage protein
VTRNTSFDIDAVKARKQLERASKRLYGYAENVLLENQERLKEAMLSHAPEDTGALKDHIYVEVIPRPNGPVLKAGVKDLPYAVFVEFGTKFTPKHPFLRPALAEMPGYIKRTRGRH